MDYSVKVNELVTYEDGKASHIELRLRQGRPLGWAEYDAPGTLAGLLGNLGAERIFRRYPVHIADEDRVVLTAKLTALARRSPYFDRATVLLNVRDFDNQPVGGFVALLTPAQLFDLPRCNPGNTLVLENGQIVRTVDPGDSSAATLEYQGAKYVEEQDCFGRRDGELVLMTTPSSPFADRIRTRHSYYCVLSSAHAREVTTDYIYARNPFFEIDYPSLRTAIPLRVIFDGRVSPDRVVLDSTTLFAIGLPQGEPVALGGCRGRAHQLRNTLFGHRHAIARVGRTAVIDIEKPVTRLPEEMLDLLGISAGDRVSVEAAAHRSDRVEVARMSLRALPWRERSPLLIARSQTGVPDNQQLVGDEDFPQISLDLATRQRLGVVPGAAVYVRPAVSSLLGREFTSVSLILIAAIFSAAALQSMILALVSASIYLVLTVFIVGARLR
jgi:hypothetical protein